MARRAAARTHIWLQLQRFLFAGCLRMLMDVCARTRARASPPLPKKKTFTVTCTEASRRFSRHAGSKAQHTNTAFKWCISADLGTDREMISPLIGRLRLRCWTTGCDWKYIKKSVKLGLSNFFVCHNDSQESCIKQHACNIIVENRLSMTRFVEKSECL